MVAPSGEGAERCMRMALSTVKTPIDYINPHATSTPAGDPPEIEAIRKVFGTGDKCPPISATKALTGHSLGATGVQEAIYSLLMMNNGFVCESANITELDPVVRRHADRAQAHRQRQARHRAVELVRLRRHQRHAGVQADGCVISLCPRFACGERPAGRRMVILQQSGMGCGMIIEPRVRGFICTTAHPARLRHKCPRADRLCSPPGRRSRSAPSASPCWAARPAMASASRIVATFAGGADTIGVSLEREPSESRSGSAGWYNNRAFEIEAEKIGRSPLTLEGDAFSDELKKTFIERVREKFGQLDMLVYSMAAPVRDRSRHRQDLSLGDQAARRSRSRSRRSTPKPARCSRPRSSRRTRSRRRPPSL